MNSATVETPQIERPHFVLYKRQQAQIARQRLFPTTVFYTTFFLIIMVLAFRSKHLLLTALFFVAGVFVWTLVEYAFHRWVLHAHFADGKGIIRKWAHQRLDPLHFEHHKRPWDATHITGMVSDLLPLFFVAAPLSFIGPIYTLPVVLAACVECYIFEEWAHYTMHFMRIRNRYFRYVKRFHLYHHSSKGETSGYGMTNGFWDIVFGTRYPKEVRTQLFGKQDPYVPARRPDLPIAGPA